MNRRLRTFLIPRILILFSGTCIVQYVTAQMPSIVSFVPTGGSIGTLVTITGSNLNNATSVTIGGTSAILLSNTGTTIVAMTMPGTVTGGATITTSSGTASSGSNFTVKPNPAPSLQRTAKLVASGTIGSAPQQGSSVSISADGSTAIVGSFADNSNQGAAFIYIRSGDSWIQQAKLDGTGGSSSALQGTAVAISADGNTAVMGGSGDGNSSVGAIWVFSRNGTAWIQQGSKLVGTAVYAGALLGFSVSISADGNTIAAGGPHDLGYDGSALTGAVWVFSRIGSSWSQQGIKLVGTGWIGTSTYQGTSVSLSADGNTLISGGFIDNSGIGAAWVFTRNGSTWVQQGEKLVAAGTSGGIVYQGASVGLSADGNTAIVGGYGDNLPTGAAWIYTRNSSVWTQRTKLVGTGNATSYTLQGSSVAISADGRIALVGGRGADTETGAHWIFTRNGDNWTQQGQRITGTGNTGMARQGESMSISSDGTTSIVGGSGDNSNVGAAWIFVSPAQSLNFDGVDDKLTVVIPSTGTMPEGNSTYTIEAWIKPVNSTVINGIIGWGIHGTAGGLNIFRTSDATDGAAGGLVNAWEGSDLFVAPSGFNLFDGGWHHVAATFDGISRKIYVDGIVRGQDNPTTTGHIVTAVNCMVGATNASSGFFGGNMDELRVWKRALCQAELQNNMNCSLNPVGQLGLALLYHFNHGVANADNTSITFVADATGNDNNGVLNNFAETGVTSNWTEGLVMGNCSVYTPSSLAGIPGGPKVCQQEVIQSVGLTYVDQDCELVASIIPSGVTPLSGNVTVCVTVNPTVTFYNGYPYVQRFYDITPANNAATSTGTVTLFYTQSEFDAYNAVRGINPRLPSAPDDLVGITNLRISQMHGAGTNPGDYSGATIVINPDDSKIVWNNLFGRWEVTFDVNGFSGFFVRTISQSALPVSLTNFDGRNIGAINLLEWTTSQEQNSSSFELQRSFDGILFATTSTITASGNSNTIRHYSYSDGIAGLSHVKYYYRLKMIDANGKINISNVIIISIVSSGFSFAIYPNPVKDRITISIETGMPENAAIKLSDLSGKSILQQSATLQKGINLLLINMPDKLPAGIYLLKLITKTQQQSFKIIKGK